MTSIALVLACLKIMLDARLGYRALSGLNDMKTMFKEHLHRHDALEKRVEVLEQN